jgi:hypothetical protein
MPKQSAVDREVLTLPEAAARSGIDVRFLRAAVHRGELPAYTGGTMVARVFWSDLTHWLRQTPIRQPGAPEDGTP